MSLLQPFLDAAKAYAATPGEHVPLDLGVRKRAAVVTCMDSRLFPEKILGLRQGDCEVIRNGGGRVTDDVIRSLMVAQQLLNCNEVYVIHHTNCGAQNAIRNIGLTAEHARYELGKALGADLGGTDMRPILSQEASIKEDVALLRDNEHVGPRAKSIVGLLFDTHSAELRVVARHDNPSVAEEHAAAK